MQKVQAKGPKGPSKRSERCERSKKVAKLVQFWIRLENVLCKFIGVVMVLHDLDVVPDDTFGHLAPEALLVVTLG